VEGQVTIPVNWPSFLRVNSNKTELFRFLSEAVLNWFDMEDKQLVITDGQEVISKPQINNVVSLSPCNHEEADSRMLLHAKHATQYGHHNILIRTVDTDVVVLAIFVAQTLAPEDELWLAFGIGKNFRYLAAHEIAAGLGPQRAKTLPIFHALTGCDAMSSFSGHGKKTAWAIWTAYPDLTTALLKVSCAASTIPVDIFHSIERL